MQIALVGANLKNRNLAPILDPEWTVWTCSPRNRDLGRFDAFFELHSAEKLFSERDRLEWPGYVEWLERQSSLVVHSSLQERYPHATVYPREEMVREFGPYFFLSSIAWMLALAISKKPSRIGFWGIEQMHESEYASERPGTHHFIQVARDRGIEIETASNSQLLTPPPFYE